jgi:hypothetical protein
MIGHLADTLWNISHSTIPMMWMFVDYNDTQWYLVLFVSTVIFRNCAAIVW